jgi:hypothetical protein
MWFGYKPERYQLFKVGGLKDSLHSLYYCVCYHQNVEDLYSALIL